MALTTSLTAGIGCDLVGTVGLNTAFTLPINGTYSVQLLTGTGSSQADKVYGATRTITASSSENLDLAGVLVDALGATLTFVKVKALYFKASSGNTNNVVIGNHATAAFVGPFDAATDTITLPPNGVFMVTAPVGGWTVTATTADMIKVANSGGGSSVTYDVIIVGTSA